MNSTPSAPMFGSDDPLSVTLEAAVRAVLLVVLAAWVVTLFALRNLAASAVLAAVASTWVFLGRVYAVYMVLVLVTGLLAWRLLAANSFRGRVKPRLEQCWRDPLYRLIWPHIARRHRLVAHDDRVRGSHRQLVRLQRVRVTSSGLERLLLRLPAGTTPADVEAACDGVAHAFRCRNARTSPAKPGRVWLELQRTDSLEQPIAPLLTATADVRSLPVGRHEDGSAWNMRLGGTHVLIAGATGAGKGSLIWSLMNAMSPGIRSGEIAVWAIDPKGGMELRPGRNLFARFEDGNPERMCDLLEELAELKDRRAKTLADEGLRSHSPSAESPHVVIVIDELATLTAFAERTVVRRIDQALGLLLTQGRACGITVVAAVQDPGKDVVGWRDLFPTRVAMRLDNPIQVDMVLGEGARDRGARADQISELTPGVAYVRVEGTRELRRTRATYLTDQNIADLAATTPAEQAAA